MTSTRVERIQKPLSTVTAGIANISKSENATSDVHLKERLPIINCECGAEILLLPDLQAMNRAIKTHMAEHRKNERNTKKNSSASGKICQLLSQLSLIKISERTET
jgi:hypothetical protein